MTRAVTPEERERWAAELKDHVAALEAMFRGGSRLTLLVRNDAMGDEVFLVTNEPDPLDAFRQASAFVESGRAIDFEGMGGKARGA